MKPEDVLVQNLGTILTVGGSVVVAFIGGMSLIWAKGKAPAREPVPIQDIWEENRQVTREYRELRGKHGELEDKFDGLADEFKKYRTERDAEVKITRHAVEILWNYVERIKAAWGSDAMPNLTPDERNILTQVIADV